MRKLNYSLILFFLATFIGNQIIEKNGFLIDFKTTPKVEQGWLCLPENNKQFLLTIRTENIKEIKIYQIPTGTNTYHLRELITHIEDIDLDGTTEININLNNKKSLLDHIHFEGIDVNNKTISEVLFNVISPCNAE